MKTPAAKGRRKEVSEGSAFAKRKVILIPRIAVIVFDLRLAARLLLLLKSLEFEECTLRAYFLRRRGRRSLQRETLIL